MSDDVVVGAAIMADPRRARHVPYLVERLGPDATITWDAGDQIRWNTGRRAWLAYRDHPRVTHWLVVQDDAIVCRDLIAGVQRAVTAVPDHPVSLYVGRKRPRAAYVRQLIEQAADDGNTWIAMEGPIWGVAICIPVAFIEDMIAWCDARVAVPHYDRRLTRYFLHRGIDCYYTVPSLVDHRTGPQEPSLVSGKGLWDGRVAHQFIGAEASAAEIDWTATATTRPASMRNARQVSGSGDAYVVLNTTDRAIVRAGVRFEPHEAVTLGLTGSALQEVRACSGLSVHRG